MNGLAVENLSAGYGDIRVLTEVCLAVDVPGVTAVIGSNGAGKTTLLRSLSGLIRPTLGSITLDGVSLTGLAPHDFVAAGITHVPEGRRLFAGMTVQDNLLMGAFSRRLPSAAAARELEAAYAVFPKLADRRYQDAVSLSGGEQQMCAIARGLMAKPRLMLIDELSLGLAPVIVDVLVASLKTLAAEGLGLLVVEQDVAVALDLADHVVVLDRGQVTRAGQSADMLADPAIRAAYLGGI